MNNSKYDPERIHQRKLIINSSIAILVLILVLWGWIHEHTYIGLQQASNKL